jgi:hypothetical protein
MHVQHLQINTVMPVTGKLPVYPTCTSQVHGRHSPVVPASLDSYIHTSVHEASCLGQSPSTVSTTRLTSGHHCAIDVAAIG